MSANEAIQQLEERARAAAETLATARRTLGLDYSAMLLFPEARRGLGAEGGPSSRPNGQGKPQEAHGGLLSTNPMEIAKEWEVEIDGVGAGISLPMERLGWAPLGSYGMRLHSESSMVRQRSGGAQMLGAGCFALRYTQPYFDVIATQFRKPEYVPNITLKIEPICPQSPWSTNADVTAAAAADAEAPLPPPLPPITVESLAFQKALGFINEGVADPSPSSSSSSSSSVPSSPSLETVVAALKRRLMPSHAPFGSFRFVSTYVVSLGGDEGGGNQQQKKNNNSTSTNINPPPAHSPRDPFAHLLTDPAAAPDTAVLNTSCYCLANGYLYTLAIEALKEVHDKYVGEVVGGRIGKGIVVTPSAVVAKSLGDRMARGLSAAMIVGAGGSPAAPTAAQRAAVAALLPHVLPEDHALAAAARGIDFTVGPHRRLIRGIPSPLSSSSSPSPSPAAAGPTLSFLLSMKVPLEWCRLGTALVEEGASATTEGAAEGAAVAAGIGCLAVDPTTKRVALLSSSSGASSSPIAPEPLAVEEGLFGAASACSSSASPHLPSSAAFTIDRFVTTPSGYSTASQLPPELVSVVTATASSSSSAQSAEVSLLSGAAMADAFATALLISTSANGSGCDEEKGAASRASRWVEADPLPFSVAGAPFGAATLSSRRFVCWKRMEAPSAAAEADESAVASSKSFVDFITDECTVYFMKEDEAGGVSSSSPSSAAGATTHAIAIARTIRPYDCQRLLFASSSSSIVSTTDGGATSSRRRGLPTGAPMVQFLSPRGASSTRFFYMTKPSSKGDNESSLAFPEPAAAAALMASRVALTTPPADILRIIASLTAVALSSDAFAVAAASNNDGDSGSAKEAKEDAEIAEAAAAAAAAIAAGGGGKKGGGKKKGGGGGGSASSHAQQSKSTVSSDANGACLSSFVREYVHAGIGGAGLQFRLPHLQQQQSATSAAAGVEAAGADACPIALASGVDTFLYLPLGPMAPQLKGHLAEQQPSSAAAAAPSPPSHPFSRAFYPVATVSAERNPQRAIALYEQSRVALNDGRLRSRLEALGLVAAHHTFVLSCAPSSESPSEKRGESASTSCCWDVLDAAAAALSASNSSAAAGSEAVAAMLTPKNASSGNTISAQELPLLTGTALAACPTEALFAAGIAEGLLKEAGGADGIAPASDSPAAVRGITASAIRRLMAATARALRLAPAAPQPQAQRPPQSSQPPQRASLQSADRRPPRPLRWTCYYHTSLPDPATTRRVLMPTSIHDTHVLFNSCVARMLLVPSFAIGNNNSSGGVDSNGLPPSIVIDWSFVQNIEQALLEGVREELLGREAAGPSVESRGAWPLGPAQFVRDWEYVKTAMLRVVKEQIILPSAV